ncbi:hypothetical protein [Sphingosinicella sp. CPCC 101087]|uniref:hypothetical protein n=1 Tax=Sphingosinicella sp. CPCC 101087 TaxID=2497754 RepID=UPI00101D3EE2|nr:hypothetical protein [Sphingosinicella sp. CPCC 101087]
MTAHRCGTVWISSLALMAAAPVMAQTGNSAPPNRFDAAPSDSTDSTEPDVQAALREGNAALAEPGSSGRDGLIAALPLDDNIQLGVGRFSIAGYVRQRTNIEAERHPMALQPRQRGIAAVGISFSF